MNPNFRTWVRFPSPAPTESTTYKTSHAATAAPFGSNWNCFWTWSTGIFARVEHSHAFRRVTHLLTNFQQKCTLSGRKYVPRNARVYCSKTATGGVLSVVER